MDLNWAYWPKVNQAELKFGENAPKPLQGFFLNQSNIRKTTIDAIVVITAITKMKVR